MSKKRLAIELADTSEAATIGKITLVFNRPMSWLEAEGIIGLIGSNLDRRRA